MDDLPSLIRQRDALDRKIGEAQRKAEISFNARLDDLAGALAVYARSQDEEIFTTERKNVRTACIPMRVAVEFAYEEDACGGYLVVRGHDRVIAEFTKGLPSRGVFMALVRALYVEARSEAEQ